MKYKELYDKYVLADPLALLPPGVLQSERATGGSPVEMVTVNGNAVVEIDGEWDVEYGGV